MGKKRKPRPDDRARVVDAGDSGGKVKKKKANGATTKASRRKGGGASANGDGRPYDPSRTLSKPAPPPPAYTPSVPTGAYITPEHDEYDACVARSYVGFVVDPPRVLPDELHADVAAAFDLSGDGVLDASEMAAVAEKMRTQQELNSQLLSQLEACVRRAPPAPPRPVVVAPHSAARLVDTSPPTTPHEPTTVRPLPLYSQQRASPAVFSVQKSGTEAPRFQPSRDTAEG